MYILDFNVKYLHLKAMQDSATYCIQCDELNKEQSMSPYQAFQTSTLMNIKYLEVSTN